jgi:hypothetical protein
MKPSLTILSGALGLALRLETIQEETDCDNFMSCARGKELGIIDDVIKPPSAIRTRQPALAA